MDIYMVINHNLNAIASLNPDEYPELYRLGRSTSVLQHLYMIMQHMLSYACPMWPDTDKRYFLFSERHLVSWNKAKGGTGDLSTWQSHKIFLLHAGLIKTHVVIGDQVDPILQRIWETAVSKRQRTETLWTVPLFSPRVLKHAERIAREYRENHVNLTHIRKNVIARVWGSKTANGLFRNSKHVISNAERYVEACLREAMSAAVKEKGFTTVEEIQSNGLDLCMRRTGVVADDYRTTIRKIMLQKRLLIDSAGYDYHPIRKQDKVLAIPEDHRGFIITEK